MPPKELLLGTPFSFEKVNVSPNLIKRTQIKSAFKEVPFVGIQLTEKEIQELQKAVDLSSRSPLAAAKTKELQEDIAAAWSTREKLRPFVQPNQVSKLQIQLSVQYAEETKLLLTEMQKLLSQANRLPSDEQAKTLFKLEKQGGIKQPIDFQDLCCSLGKRNPKNLLQKNPFLEPKELNHLINQTLNVLEQGKRIQKIERSLGLIENIQFQIDETPNPNVLETDLVYLDLSQKLQEALERPAAYDPQINPEYSLFEFIADIQLYPGQTADLNLLDKGESNLILQKIMGSGKSKVFLPILALKKADGVSLAIVVVPSARYETTLRDMEASSGKVFHQVTHTFTFDRNTDCSLKSLEGLRKNFNDIITKKEYLVVTDKTMHCLHNKCKEMILAYLNNCKNLKKNNPDASLPVVPPELQEIRKILNIPFKGIFDEADLLLYGRQEVNFTLGEPKPIIPEHTAIVRELYQYIYSTPEIIKLLTPKENNKLEEPIFTATQFKKEILPEIAQGFIESKTKTSSPLRNFLNGLSDKYKASILDYWYNGEKGDTFVRSLKDISLKDALAIIKEELNELLPLTLNRPINFRYGRSNNVQELLAVPYVGNNKPSPTSRFGNPYELINFTTQMYLLQGIPLSTISSLVGKLKNEAMRELSKDSSLTINLTGAYQQFEEFCGSDTSMNLMRMNEIDLLKIVTRYKEDKSAVFEFLEKYIYPRILNFSSKLTSTHLTLVDMFKEVQGFTGTPWNSDMYHSKLKIRPEKGADGKTLGILKKNSSQKIRQLSTDTALAILDELLKKVDAKSSLRAFQDTGCIFKGIENIEIAREILKRLPHIKGVRFFDQNNLLSILERGPDGRFIPVAFEKSFLKKENCFTYYDQWNTTGADIAQARSAHGFLSIGKAMTSRDLFQGAWRLRGLDQNQVVELVQTPEVADLIRKEFGLKNDVPIEFDSIIKFHQLNQIRELESQLESNVPQKIGHVLENAVWKILINVDVDLSKLVPESIPIVETLLQHNQLDTPSKNFGQMEEEISTPILLEEKIQINLRLISDLKKNNPIFHNLNEDHLKNEMVGNIPKQLIPEKLKRPIRMNRELTMEVEREQELEQEINMQRLKDLQSESASSKTLLYPINHWNWSGAEENHRVTSKEFYNSTTLSELNKLEEKNRSFPYPSFDSINRVPISVGKPPVLTLKDIFENTGFKEFSDIFSLEASANFLPQLSGGFNPTFTGHQRAFPFDKMQLEVKNFLFLKDTASEEEKMMLISAADAGYFYSEIAKEKANHPNKELTVILGEISLGVLQSDDDESAKMISQGTAWNKYVTEAKFYNGELNYSAKEQEYLKSWINEKGPDRMEKLFYQTILKYKPDQRDVYPLSILGRIFNSLRK